MKHRLKQVAFCKFVGMAAAAIAVSSDSKAIHNDDTNSLNTSGTGTSGTHVILFQLLLCYEYPHIHHLSAVPRSLVTSQSPPAT
jgi:hypothetical protein